MALGEISKFKNFFLDFFFPKFCLGCGKEKTFLCPHCFSKIKIFSAPFCPYCKARSVEGKICNPCLFPKVLKKEKRKLLTGFIAVSSYKENIIRGLIDAFKYKFVKELALSLALLIFKFLKENPEVEFFKNPLDFLILPIPLHWRRERWRGFNQAAEMGKFLSSLLKIPIRKDILFRKKSTKPQALLKEKEERKENIREAFGVIKENKIKNKKIILLDDVATSLATLEEAAKTLKEKGIKEIWGLVVAMG